ncbi:glycosyltransferase family 2 protein [uncultured Desulfuromonas sp.]|uniref:glycosyltransferase family 2 protein n=1 Tax=uncultured Desulfuromonas sp. TaxID=181013 RepID=UPI00261AB4A0|nr:glycosyltransferase family 2 protein [uncultured Desulfuromonas sp.]
MIQFKIENSLPDKLAPKNINRYLVEGWVAGGSRISDIRIRVGGKTFASKDVELYRPDVRTSFFAKEKSFQTLFPGFSIPVVVGPVEAAEEHAVMLECAFADGSSLKEKIGTVSIGPYAKEVRTFEIPPHIDQDNLLAICMATYNPDGPYFKRQIDSIIGQEHQDWICIICDDNSSEDSRDLIKEAVKDDPRFFLVENDQNAGFYGNFERCLELAPAEAKFVALADQDDIWYPHKLSSCLAEFDASTMLVYSDMKVVDKDRNVLCDTYWRNRKNYYESKDIDLLTLANTVTGAASVFRRELLDLALPFPPRYGEVFHDQWLAIMAAGNGGIRYVDEPLYEYVQYDNNVIGHTDFGRRSLFSVAKDYVREAYDIQKQHQGLFKKLLLCLKAIPCLVIGLYHFKHTHGKHIDTLAETALLRRLNASSQRLVQRTRSATGLFRIHFKVWKRKETLNNLELVFCFSAMANTLFRWAAPLLCWYMKTFLQRRVGN